MSITELVIKRPTLVVVIFTVLAILGIASYTKLGDGVIMRNNSWVGWSSRVGDYAILDGSSTAYDVVIGASLWSSRTVITDSTLGRYARIGHHASISATSIGPYAIIRYDSSVVGSTIAYGARVGTNVTIETGVSVGREAKIYDGVHIASGVQIGNYAVVCADVTTPGMVIAANDRYGCN